MWRPRINSIRRCLVSNSNFSSSHALPAAVEGSSSQKSPSKSRRLAHRPAGPGLSHFLANVPKIPNRNGLQVTPKENHPYITEEDMQGHGRKVYFDVYGCQMNVNDTEVVWSILHEYGFVKTDNLAEADIWLLVTCSIRDGAEKKIWKKLNHIYMKKKAQVYRPSLKVGVLGCMAERLKEKLLEQDRLVDVVAGPDSYRDLPRLFAITTTDNQSSINVLLSMEETYADIMPMRLDENKVTGFVSIQRGCDNMCSYCIVPFTRGKERSRPMASILDEVRYLAESGVKEITLLGQNVNSYNDTSQGTTSFSTPNTVPTATGFQTIYKPKIGGISFAELLEKVSEIDSDVRIRFVSPHPKDFPDEVLHLIHERTNICNHLHMPAQSGSTKVLADMRRGYSREAYLELVQHVRDIIPGITLSTDMIAGFCGETDSEFEETVSLMKKVQYHKAFCFPYSLRYKTHAHRKLQDDVPDKVKSERHLRLSTVYREEAKLMNEKFIGSKQTVLVEADSKRSDLEFQGRTDGNSKAIFAKPIGKLLKPGDYCTVMITGANSEGLRGEFYGLSSISGETQGCESHIEGIV